MKTAGVYIFLFFCIHLFCYVSLLSCFTCIIHWVLQQRQNMKWTKNQIKKSGLSQRPFCFCVVKYEFQRTCNRLGLCFTVFITWIVFDHMKATMIIPCVIKVNRDFHCTLTRKTNNRHLSLTNSVVYEYNEYIHYLNRSNQKYLKASN